MSDNNELVRAVIENILIGTAKIRRQVTVPCL